ncbi:MAG: hypothetical protein K6U74_02445 [Firmicutes bacterium]|nr:hypothetical protein [Bacillota bacterium]
MYVTTKYGEEQELKKNYSLKSLQSRLEDALEDIEKLKAWARLIQDQIDIVKNTKFKYVVYLHRRTTWSGKVEFNVGVWSVPCVENWKMVYYPTILAERFKGTERKQALARAKELVIEYGAELETQGFKDKEEGRLFA